MDQIEEEKEPEMRDQLCPLQLIVDQSSSLLSVRARPPKYSGSDENEIPD